MGKTTVDLTDMAVPVKQKFMRSYGLKNMVSAGLVLFGRLSSDEREKLVDEINSPLAGELKAVHDKARTRSAEKKQSQPSRRSAKK